MTAPVVERRAARVLLVDAADRVLLFHGCDPEHEPAGQWWFTPGGGLDAGESPSAGAARELAEETGLTVTAETLGPVVHQRLTEFSFGGERYRQAEDYFLLRVGQHQVDTSGFNELERRAVLGHRWWSREEVRSTSERIYPEELAEVLARALARVA